MFSLMVWLIIFVVSLIVLVKASDYFTDSAEKIGIFMKISPFIIGVTIVAIGTSLPELITSIIAVFKGSSEMVVGNVIGSNITNIFLVLGVVAILSRKKIKIGFHLINVDLPFLVGSAFLLTALIWDGVFSLFDGFLCLIGLVIYTVYAINVGKENKQIKKDMKKEVSEKKLELKTVLICAVSAIFIFVGAKYTVESVIALAEILKIGTEIIAVGAVALGTSLPELVVSITAARKGKPEMAVGNILGSNIFNTFAVMGIPALFGALIIPSSILTFALPLMIMASVLYFFITQDNEITKWEGALLLMFYVFFVGKLLGIF